MPKVEITRSQTRLPSQTNFGGFGEISFGANTGKALQQLGASVSAFAGEKVEEFKLARDNNFAITEQVKMTSDLYDLGASLKEEYADSPEGYADAYFKEAQKMLARVDDTAPSPRAATALKNRMGGVLINTVNEAKAFERQSSVATLARKADESRNIFLNSLDPTASSLAQNLAGIKEIDNSLVGVASVKDRAQLNQDSEFGVVESMVKRSLQFGANTVGEDREGHFDNAEEILKSKEVQKLLSPNEIESLANVVKDSRANADIESKLLGAEQVRGVVRDVNSQLLQGNYEVAEAFLDRSIEQGTILFGSPKHLEINNSIIKAKNEQKPINEVASIIGNGGRLDPSNEDHRKGLDLTVGRERSTSLFSKETPEGVDRDKAVTQIIQAGMLPTIDQEGLINALNSNDPSIMANAAKSAAELQNEGVNLGLNKEKTAEMAYIQRRLVAGTSPDVISSSLQESKRIRRSDPTYTQKRGDSVEKEFNKKPKNYIEDVEDLLEDSGLKGVVDPLLARDIVEQAKAMAVLDPDKDPDEALKEAGRLVVQSGGYAAVKVGGKVRAVKEFSTDGLPEREAKAQFSTKAREALRGYFSSTGLLGRELEFNTDKALEGVRFTPSPKGGHAISFMDSTGRTDVTVRQQLPDGSIMEEALTIKVRKEDSFSERVKSFRETQKEFDNVVDQFAGTASTEDELAVSKVLSSTSDLIGAQASLVNILEEARTARKFGGLAPVDTARVNEKMQEIRLQIEKNMMFVEKTLGKDKARELLNTLDGNDLQGGEADTELGGGINTDVVGGDPLQNAAEKVKSLLLENEGTGDTLTNISTGEGGITSKTKEELEKKAGRSLTDKEAREAYIDQAVETLSRDISGFSEAPEGLMAFTIDTTYNTGINSPKKWKAFKEAMSNRLWEEAGKQLLDTANSEGGSVKGIAKRRAKFYNKAFPASKITKVEQKTNGEIIYYKGDVEFFSYTPRGGKHKGSKAGRVSI